MTGPPVGGRLAATLLPGAATGVGSLPHTDPDAAADLSLGIHPHLPAAPQLPAASPHEGMLVQWLRALPEVEVAPDGSYAVTRSVPGGSEASEQIEPVLDGDSHRGLLAFATRIEASASPPLAVKLQLTGPITLGVALCDAGVDPETAFERADALASAWARALVEFAARRMPRSRPVIFLDEPSLVVWTDGDGPISREVAVDVLSGVLAGIPEVTGVHVCGRGDRRMAIEAGPQVVGFPVDPSVQDDGVALSRFLDAGGWIAWGAVPTDRPVGEHADHWWDQLVALWCDLTRGGCAPEVLRTQALVTPACGLASHTDGQAERILGHCAEIGARVREQAVATRLSLGA